MMFSPFLIQRSDTLTLSKTILFCLAFFCFKTNQLTMLAVTVSTKKRIANAGGGIGHDRFITYLNFAAGFALDSAAEVSAGALCANLSVANGNEFGNMAVTTVDSIHGGYFLSLVGKFIIAKDFKFVNKKN